MSILNKEIIKKCIYCKKLFTTTTRSERTYCSRACYHASRPKKIKYKCKNLKCGKIFLAYKNDERKYCCTRCMYSDTKWVKKQKQQIHSLSTKRQLSQIAKYNNTWAGTNNPNYKHGTFVLFRELLAKADGICSICNIGIKGFSSFLDIHHKDRNHQNNFIDNLITLCPNCHRKEHMKNWANKKLYIDSNDTIDDSCVLIFEGPDGSGKSNIAQEFVKQHSDFSYFKIKKEKLYITSLTPEEITLMHKTELEFFASFAEQVHYKVVMDRFYPSEIVYGKIFRALSKNDEKYIYSIDKKLANLNVKLVILWKTLKELHDDIFSAADLKKIKRGYREFIKNTNIKPKNILILDTTDKNLKTQLKKINNFVYDKIK